MILRSCLNIWHIYLSIWDPLLKPSSASISNAICGKLAIYISFWRQGCHNVWLRVWQSSSLVETLLTEFPLVKPCKFCIDYTLDNIPGREFGRVNIGAKGEYNLAQIVAGEGWAKVKFLQNFKLRPALWGKNKQKKSRHNCQQCQHLPCSLFIPSFF